ncbi:MAG TPA: HAD hydrolase-like protein [Pyrinomonadaceae bacterium]
MARITNVVFDLDGTLTDPAEGILRCIQHSLTALEIPCPPDVELKRFIGPPLREVFCQLCDSADEVLVERAVTVFRERFSTIGLFENTPYPAVSQMLIDLSGESYNLYVATSKPQVYAEQILKHFSLADHFIEIHGNDLAGHLDDKAELLRDLLERRNLDPQATIMVGDRKHDVIAAQKNGVSSLGVTYGYGSKEELTEAGANYLAETPGEVVDCIVELS